MFKTTRKGQETHLTGVISSHPILSARQKLGLSQSMLGYLLGVTTNAIYLYEKNKIRPNKQVLMLLDMLLEGKAIPDRIRLKYMKRYHAPLAWQAARRKRKGYLDTAQQMINIHRDGV